MTLNTQTLTIFKTDVFEPSSVFTISKTIDTLYNPKAEEITILNSNEAQNLDIIDLHLNNEKINILKNNISASLLSFTMVMLEAPYCIFKKENFKTLITIIREELSKLLNIMPKDIVINKIYGEPDSSNYDIKRINIDNSCNLENGELRGTMIDFIIVKDLKTNYPTIKNLNDISNSQISLIKDKFGTFIIFSKDKQDYTYSSSGIVGNESQISQTCKSMLLSAPNINYICINNPINCIFNNNHECYKNPLGSNCFCYKSNDGENMNKILTNFRYSKDIKSMNNINGYTQNQLDISTECNAIVSCTKQIIEPIIGRCSSSPYSIGCPCNLNLYSKLCGCYLNPNNPGCPCSYNPISIDCKCLRNPVTCNNVSNKPYKKGIMNFPFRTSSTISNFNFLKNIKIQILSITLIILFNFL
ncbi:hypothetical protein ACR3K2_38620 [Cryptosporidium serpentis]